MKSFLQVADQYYVLATSVLADKETRVLKGGETFAIFDPHGDILPMTHAEAGLFHKGTRYLSRYEFNLDGDERPLLLGSVLRDDNGVLKVDLTNPDLDVSSQEFLRKGSLYIHREKFVVDSKCGEKISIFNYGEEDVDLDGHLRLEADFQDIFEVRGTSRAKRGAIDPMIRDGDRLILSYLGLDGVRRSTCVQIRHLAFETRDNEAIFRLRIPKRGSLSFEVNVALQEAFHGSREAAVETSFEAGLSLVQTDHDSGQSRFCSVQSSNEQFEAWMKRSTDDLVMMTTSTPEGYLYPYAGIPWYCAAFGRDGILTALECLWANPDLARGSLLYLAATQATEHVPEQDSTPGKIIHEVRYGEMAKLKEVPFGRYYGSIDSTPLFVCLAGAYLSRTNDVELVRKIWPNLEQAIFWMDRYGDLDGDGFIEYERENPNGLVQQGWKDSHDSIFHADGSDARGPIALAEVQAYAYLARIEGAKMAELLGHRDLAEDLRKKAHKLKDRFDEVFWLDEIKAYAMALDGDKKPCRVLSSNAGQCLFTGIVKPERASPLVKAMMSHEGFSGWGVRTVATGALRYNPMSYHNGSVWPHDTALVAYGMARMGFKSEVARVFSGMFRSAIYADGYRMPEVYCGFARREGEAPTIYPNACAPQAWAAASIYIMVQSLLGLTIDATQKRVCFSHPTLPDSIETLRIKDLAVGEAELDIVIQNYHSDVSIQIVDRRGDVAVSVEK